MAGGESVDQFVTTFVDEQNHLLDAAMLKLRHCMQQLTDDQLWWRPAPDQNSIANLIIHVCGNMTQWIQCGVAGETDNRQRQAEFDATDGMTSAELIDKLESVLVSVRQTIGSVPSDQLLTTRTVQGFQVTGMGAIVHSITHFVGHTHQIIQLTRQQLGDGYAFQWSPNRTNDPSLPI